LIFIDYATSAPYVKINCNNGKSYYDAIFISPHKFYGGPGTSGILMVKSKIINNKIPFCAGGGTVKYVNNKNIIYSNNIIERESGGTPNIIGNIKCGLVFQYKDNNIDHIIKRNKEINKLVLDKLLKIKNLELLNSEILCDQLPIYSFRIKNILNNDYIHYNLIVVLLNDIFGI
jgi:selenocysteine lyase/cysteine desulfurase